MRVRPLHCKSPKTIFIGFPLQNQMVIFGEDSSRLCAKPSVIINHWQWVITCNNYIPSPPYPNILKNKRIQDQLSHSSDISVFATPLAVHLTSLWHRLGSSGLMRAPRSTFALSEMPVWNELIDENTGTINIDIYKDSHVCNVFNTGKYKKKL